MDFTLNEEQSAIAELAGKILGDLCTARGAPRPRASPAIRCSSGRGPSWPPADLLGVALPEAVGGGGYGILEAPSIAEQVGRHVAPVPVRRDDRGRRSPSPPPIPTPNESGELLRTVATGTTVLTVGARRSGPAIDGPTPTAEAWDAVGRRQHSCAGPARPRLVLVPASGDDGSVALFAVDPAGAGRGTSTTRTPCGACPRRRSSSAARRPAASAARRGRRRPAAPTPTALQCATVAGVCEGALRLTAAYVTEREQFGTKIGTFQAVGQRMADAYIDTQGVQLTARQAAWRLSAGLPADEELHIAKWWAATAATGSSTPRSTCTAASASTSTTRCTATSGGPRSSSSSSARAPSTSASSGRCSPLAGVGRPV